MVLASEEHSRVTEGLGDQTGMREFQSLVSDCELTDMFYNGPLFIWWNHQDGDPIGKKLDRAKINRVWCDTYPQSFANFETNGISDHARYVVKIEEGVQEKKHHFQFLNYLADHPQFIDIVSEYWNETEPLFHSRSALNRFHRKLKQLKPLLRALNRERYRDITKRTRVSYEVLCARQEDALRNPCPDTFQAEQVASVEWQHYAEVEEKFFQQKSHISWLKHRDQNTTVFHRLSKPEGPRTQFGSWLTLLERSSLI
ncbi:unnamed protein product [Arabis nemorensis]|uniref:Endonuclease/exonuclease/phosphatase domain-containing protein n=1 Tax=Arabis nemorensis TaxID=586526 RepID=A0A565BIA4_9BRAS|nr:unnamed protein product [Arabis nemorensis]